MAEFFAAEVTLLDMLTACAAGCIVMEIPDYFGVLEFGGNYAKDYRPGAPHAAIFVWYGGYRVANALNNGCCVDITQTYHIAIVTKHFCDMKSNRVGRTQHGEVVKQVFDCINASCDNASCKSFRLVTPPNFPIPVDDNGIMTTILSTEISYQPSLPVNQF